MATKLDHKPWRHNLQRNFTYEFAGEVMSDVQRAYPMGHQMRVQQWRRAMLAINEANAIIHRMIMGH